MLQTKPTRLNDQNRTAINIRIPFQLSEEGGGYFLSNNTTIDAILEDIIAILSTRIGERVMNPSLGSHLKEYVFEQQTDALKAKVSTEIRRVIAQYFSGVKITKIEVLTYEEDSVSPVNGYRVKIYIEIPELSMEIFEPIIINFSG